MTELSAVMPQIVQIPLTDLVVPAWNPRRHLDEAEMAQLVAYLEKGGSVQRILVWSPNGQAPWSVVSGQRRSEAYRRLGRTYIEAEILAIPLAEAQLLAETSNNGAEAYWLDKYENWEALMRDLRLSQPQLADRIGRSQPAISRGMTVLKVLNPASRALIRQHLEGQTSIPSSSTETSPIPDPAYQNLIDITPGTPPTYQTLITPLASSRSKSASNPSQPILIENVAYQLTVLLANRPLEEAQTLANQALPRLLQGNMTASQATQWVKHLLDGQNPAQFQLASRAKSKAVKPASLQTSASPAVDHPDQSSAPLTPSPVEAQPATMGTSETLAWDVLAGVSPITRIKTKIKKGERPTLFEALLLAEHGLWTGFAWVFQQAYKLAKGIGKGTWRLTQTSLKVVLKALGRTVYNFTRVVLALAVLGLLAWLAYDLYIRGFHWGQALEDIFSALQQTALIIWKYR